MTPTRTVMNPLEGPLSTIEGNRNYITPSIVERLLALIPESAKTGVSREAELDSDLSLDSMLKRLSRLVKTMETQTVGNNNSADTKAVIMAAKDLFNLVAKHGQAVSAEKKTEILRMTIVETLEEMSDTSKKTFLDKWEKRIRTEAANNKMGA